jgi:hypothetical protein
MKTVGGRWYDFLPEWGKGLISDVRIEDIAHSLALQNRYMGHTQFPYSVAQHSVLVSEQVKEENALWGLLHDAGEAFIGDIGRPVKTVYCAVQEIEDCFLRQVIEHFGLKWPMPSDVKVTDNRVMVTEMSTDWIYAHEGVDPEGACGVQRYPDLEIKPVSWMRAKQEFLDRFWNLFDAE